MRRMKYIKPGTAESTFLTEHLTMNIKAVADAQTNYWASLARLEAAIAKHYDAIGPTVVELAGDTEHDWSTGALPSVFIFTS